MIENSEKYRELVIKLEKEINLLKKIETTSSSIQAEINNNINIIDDLKKENKDLGNEIKRIINKKLCTANIYVKLLSIIFIVMSIVIAASLSNHNIIITFLFSLFSPLLCIYFNYAITKLLEKSYRKRNKKIIVMESLISDNKLKLNQYEEKNKNLHEDIIEITTVYDRQKSKVVLIEDLINEIKVGYVSPSLEDMNDKKVTDEVKHVVKVKRPEENKTREI